MLPSGRRRGQRAYAAGVAIPAVVFAAADAGSRRRTAPDVPVVICTTR